MSSEINEMARKDGIPLAPSAGSDQDEKDAYALGRVAAGFDTT